MSWSIGRVLWPAQIGTTAIPCLSFTEESFTSSTSWVVDLPPGEADDFMFAYVMATQIPSAVPTGWTEEGGGGLAFGGTREYFWRKVRAAETSFTINFGAAASGSVILVNAQIDPALPGDSWGGNAYNALSGDFAGVVEPFVLNTFYGGSYDPDGTPFLMQVRHTGNPTSQPGSPWVLEASGTVGTVTHRLYVWHGTGTAPNFTWDTDGATREVSFIEPAHLCSR